ncbi:MAG: dCTP deaminase [Candidatus Aenigmatarchaeota archaeon]
MILSDKDIKEHLKSGKLVIEDLDQDRIKAAWVDLSLGNEFRIFKISQHPFIDVKKPIDNTEKIIVNEGDTFMLHPGEFILGHIKEKISIPDDLAAYVDGQSSLGRIGMVVHITAGFVDPGYHGKLTLEMTNVGKLPILIHPGMKICKLVLFKLSSPAEMPYYKRKDAKYLGQKGAEATQIHKDFEKA